MRPVVVITIDGQPISTEFAKRLISVTVNDREGIRSDSVEIEVEARDPFVAIPKSKAIIAVSMGYIAPVYMGSFTADDVDLKFSTLSISGKAADMRSPAKEHLDKHYDDKTVKDIVSDLAKRMGVSAQVDGEIGAVKMKWFAVEGESPIHAVNRLADRVNGLAAHKDGKLIFAKRGSGTKPGGGAIAPLIITPSMMDLSTWSVKFTERERYKKVKATYHDKDKAKRETVETDADPKGEATYTLRHNHADKKEAETAAKAKAKDLERQATQTSVTIEGNPAARGGAPMAYKSDRIQLHPEAVGIEFVIENAAHNWTKGGGYTTGITAKKKV